MLTDLVANNIGSEDDVRSDKRLLLIAMLVIQMDEKAQPDLLHMASSYPGHPAAKNPLGNALNKGAPKGYLQAANKALRPRRSG